MATDAAGGDTSLDMPQVVAGRVWGLAGSGQTVVGAAGGAVDKAARPEDTNQQRPPLPCYPPRLCQFACSLCFCTSACNLHARSQDHQAPFLPFDHLMIINHHDARSDADAHPSICTRPRSGCLAAPLPLLSIDIPLCSAT
uniref:Uncharacterized protein n=1 Tax=Setaria viridis TaxID=4556 RepID=A0A4V6Y8L0_SETVI|nr:hypothetical protein SEVIR_3G011100v2 [Setaria viridis]